MARTVHRQVFVALPLLRAIERLPDSIEVDGTTLRFTGEVSSAPIMIGFAAHRATVECGGRVGWVDLSSASSSRCDMTLCLQGIRVAVVEDLVLALRREMTEGRAVAPVAADDRIVVCRSA
ncbi:MAG: hypothetical protein QOD38_1493 [Acidimicrobiaceae bacterium]|jgi:hypothetical protein